MDEATPFRTKAQLDQEIETIKDDLEEAGATPQTAYRLLLWEPTKDNYKLVLASLADSGFLEEAIDLLEYALLFFPDDLEFQEAQNADADRLSAEKSSSGKKGRPQQVVLVKDREEKVRKKTISLNVYKDRILRGYWKECPLCRQTFSVDRADKGKYGGMICRDVKARFCSKDCQNKAKKQFYSQGPEK